MEPDLVYQPEDWPGGARCADCMTPFEAGQRYSVRLMSLTGDGTPITLVTCVPCGLGAQAPGG